MVNKNIAYKDLKIVVLFDESFAQLILIIRF